MFKLFKFMKPYVWLIVILVALTYIQVMANLRLPDYMAKIVNEGIVAENNSAVWNNGLLMIAVTFVAAVCSVGVGYLAARIATSFAKDVREKLFSNVEGFSLNEFNKFSTASLITRSTNDIQQVQMVTIMTLRMVVMAPIMGIAAVQKAYSAAPSMSWIIALAVIVMLGLIAVMFTIALPKFKLLQKMVDRLNLVTRENLTGLRVIRAFNNEKREEDKFEVANEDLTKLNLFVNRLMVIMQPLMMLIFNLTLVAIIWYGAHLIDKGSLEIGNMMAFMQYAMNVIMAFLFISIIFIMFPRASVSAKRIYEVIETESTIKDPEKPVKVDPKGQGKVEFKDVTFSYPEADLPILTGVSFTAEPGKTTAIIGSTGSGKSTLINLIPRFYDVTAGQVLVDGIDVRDMKLEDLYKQIGYVPQKGILFSGTVKSNIKYGDKETTDAEVKKSAKIAQATEFIEKYDDKFDSPIAQGGQNVSGGQKQRLAIARALARNPRLYIFDDSFSALDFATDAKLRAELAKETKERTVIIVGQRIGTIMSADKIIVLDEGKIVGEGNHHQLIKDNEVYREIAYSQLSDEELAAIPEKKTVKAGKEAR